MQAEDDSDEDNESDHDEKVDDDRPKLSKKKMKKLNRLSVAELKQVRFTSVWLSGQRFNRDGPLIILGGCRAEILILLFRLLDCLGFLDCSDLN